MRLSDSLSAAISLLIKFITLLTGLVLVKTQLDFFGVAHFGKWWVDDDTARNNRFADHINQFAIDWIGDFTETQFSVNMLVVDQKTVISVNENRELNDFLDQRGINVIIAPFRAKSFWDGGLHCLTVDVVRDGDKRDLFPDRAANNYLDWM